MYKSVIWSLNKLDLSYNPDSINYINEKFKDMTLEDASQEKELYAKKLTLVCCHQHKTNHRTFKKHGITNIKKNVKYSLRQYERN